jgi:hypothetical protein
MARILPSPGNVFASRYRRPASAAEPTRMAKLMEPWSDPKAQMELGKLAVTGTANLVRKMGVEYAERKQTYASEAADRERNLAELGAEVESYKGKKYPPLALVPNADPYVNALTAHSRNPNKQTELDLISEIQTILDNPNVPNRYKERVLKAFDSRQRSWLDEHVIEPLAGPSEARRKAAGIVRRPEAMAALAGARTLPDREAAAEKLGKLDVGGWANFEDLMTGKTQADERAQLAGLMPRMLGHPPAVPRVPGPAKPEYDVGVDVTDRTQADLSARLQRQMAMAQGSPGFVLSINDQLAKEAGLGAREIASLRDRSGRILIGLPGKGAEELRKHAEGGFNKEGSDTYLPLIRQGANERLHAKAKGNYAFYSDLNNKLRDAERSHSEWRTMGVKEFHRDEARAIRRARIRRADLLAELVEQYNARVGQRYEPPGGGGDVPVRHGGRSDSYRAAQKRRNAKKSEDVPTRHGN